MARATPHGPSLAVGIVTCILGLLVLAVAPLLLVPGFRLAMTPGTGIVGPSLAGTGILVVAIGCLLLGLGARGIHRFERRLMVAMRSRPWTDSSAA